MSDDSAFAPESTPAPTPDLVLPERNGGYVRGRENYELILRAAMRLLMDGGYSALTMRAVAKAADIQYGNLTYYFPTRNDLIRDLLDAIIGGYEIFIKNMIMNKNLSPEDQLRKFCISTITDIQTEKTTKLFMELWALSNHDDFTMNRIHELYNKSRKYVEIMIAAIRPDLDHESIASLSLFIISSLEGMTIFIGHNMPHRHQTANISKIAIESYLSAIKSHTPA